MFRKVGAISSFNKLRGTEGVLTEMLCTSKIIDIKNGCIHPSANYSAMHTNKVSNLINNP
jgi:hypothetical protein